MAQGAQEVNFWQENVFITLHSTVAIYKTYRHIRVELGQIQPSLTVVADTDIILIQSIGLTPLVHVLIQIP